MFGWLEKAPPLPSYRLFPLFFFFALFPTYDRFSIVAILFTFFCLFSFLHLFSSLPFFPLVGVATFPPPTPVPCRLRERFTCAWFANGF